MDHRAPLKVHTVLPFDGMSCHIQDVVGQGSNAIVYKGWYPDRITPEVRHHVLIKELFPFHPQQKIRRTETGEITVDPEARDVWETHRASFEAGNSVHLRLLEQQPELMALGSNLNSFHFNGTLYSVLGYTGGRSLQSELNGSPQDLRCWVIRMRKLLSALDAFHSSGHLHLDISPDNIMLVGNGEQEHLFLIDYNSARRTDDTSGGYLSCKAGYSPPELTAGDETSIGYSSDLYAVTAVFYRCLMGRKLTLAETLMPKAPDGSTSPLLTGAPQTVADMVSRILRKGLNTLPFKRYQTTEHLRHAFDELLNRIDGTGVTHWALWESGIRSVDERIRVNPSLGYLRQRLYPIRLAREHNALLDRYLEELLSPAGQSSLLLAQGGMGKTTLLLRTAMLYGKRYTSATPAVFYISVSGWNGSDTRFIRTQILRSLRFRRKENTFDTAMQALHRLLDQPIRTKAGSVPTVLLLLDGMNEIRGETGPLFQEIRELNALAGVRILAASRSEIPALDLVTERLAPLHMEDIETALGDQGLLIPEDANVMQLLRTPLILSIYIQASEGRQLDIHDETGLMDAYLDSLRQKEQSSLTEETDVFWQIDAALTLVLPCIAVETLRTGQALTDQQLLPILKTCFRLMTSRSMHKTFPQWIGRSRQILGDAQTPEQWHGIIVQNLLWQRMGLLIREPDGGYRIFHQILEEYLAGQAKGLLPFRYRKQKILAAVFATVLCASLAAGGIWYCNDSNIRMEKVIEYTASGYQSSGSLYSQLRDLTDFALEGNLSEFSLWYDRAMDAVNQAAKPSITKDIYQTYILEEARSRILWNGKPFQESLALELLNYSQDQAVYYARMLPALKAWLGSEQMQTICPDFAKYFSKVLETEAALVSELYQQSCAVHIPQRNNAWAENLQTTIAELTAIESFRTEVRDDRSPSLADLRKGLQDARSDLEYQYNRLARLLAENMDILRDQLEDIRRLNEEAGITELDTKLNSMDQILDNMDAHYHARFPG